LKECPVTEENIDLIKEITPIQTAPL